jgi:hypothetical protein
MRNKTKAIMTGSSSRDVSLGALSNLGRVACQIRECLGVIGVLAIGGDFGKYILEFAPTEAWIELLTFG